MIEINPIEDINDILPGDNLSQIIGDKLISFKPLTKNDVLIVSSIVISKARGRLISLENEAIENLIQSESKNILRKKDGITISQTHHGIICENAGIQTTIKSNNTAILLPKDIDSAAYALHQALNANYKINIPIIITKTVYQPFRKGKANVAVGVYGVKTKSSENTIADNLANAAEIVMKSNPNTCAVLIRGIDENYFGDGKATDFIPETTDLLFQ